MQDDTLRVILLTDMFVLSTVCEELHQANASYLEWVFIRSVCMCQISFLANIMYFVKHHVRQTGDINYIILYKMGEPVFYILCICLWKT
jgi:hypothetical protein